MEAARPPVKQQILEALRAGQSLTGLDAWQRFGTSRLAALIHRLRREGHQINAETIGIETAHGHVAHIARYSMRGAE